MMRQWLPTLRGRSEGLLRPVSIAEMLEDLWRSPSGLFTLTEGLPRRSFGEGAAFPALNVSASEKEIAVDAELPGLEAKDVSVTLEDGSLIISGEKKFEDEEKKDNYHRIERSYGTFRRAVALPAKVDAAGVKARFEKGVLHVTLPKAEPSSQAQKISVEG